MNKENILKVADAIEANPEKFDLNHYIGGCGTTACVAGWAYVLSKNAIREDGSFVDSWDIEDHAIKFLDIDESQGDRLFKAGDNSVWVEYADKYDIPTTEDCFGVHIYYGHWSKVPAAMAVEVLRDIANGVTEL